MLVEAAYAVGAARSPWGRDLLIRALAHGHPKVVRAAADALGNFRDGEVAGALDRFPATLAPTSCELRR